MQAGQYEKLKKLIEASHVLDPAEKSQWLEMLPLMNDKQLFELEGVLNAPAQSSAPVKSQAIQPTQTPAPANNSRLSHISNLPTSLNGPQNNPAKPSTNPVPLSQTSKPVPSPSRITFANQAQRPPQPAQVKQATQVPLSPLQTPSQTPSQTRRYSEELLKQKSLQTSPGPVIPKEPIKTNPTASPSINLASEQSRSRKPGLDYRNLLTGGPQKISLLSDVANMTAATYRVLHSSGFLSALEQLVKSEGYFNVWFAIEKSPLYKLYLHTGELMLTNSTDESILTKEEFESLTDIFREIQA